MKQAWGAFKDARNIGWIILAALAAVTYFSGRFDEIHLLEFWTLTLVSAAASIYVAIHWSNEKATAAMVVLFLIAALFSWLIIHRQNLRYDAYEASYDIAFNNTTMASGADAAQIGLCILNPNNFTIFAKISSIAANIGNNSGSYSNEGRIRQVPRYSNSLHIFSDPIEIPQTESLISPTGVIRATVDYGRSESDLSKRLEIEVDIAYIQNATNGDIMGIQGNVLRGDSPNSFALAPQQVSSCRVLGQR
jgi:hypothetical protein